jgi:hypothetical protein
VAKANKSEPAKVEGSAPNLVIPRQSLHRRVYASQGTDFLFRPVLVEETRSKEHKAGFWMLATDAPKDPSEADSVPTWAGLSSDN